MRKVSLTVLFALLALPMAPRSALADEPPGPDDVQPSTPPPPQPMPPPAPRWQPPPAYPPPVYTPRAPRLIRYEERPRWGLFAAGLGIFGGPYLMSLVAGYISANYWYMVPVVGPLAYLNGKDDPQTRWQNTGLVFLTAIQATGVVLAITGLVLHKKVPIYAKVQLVPVASSDGGGLAAVGRF